MDTVIAILTDPRVVALASPIIVSGVKKVLATLPKPAIPVLSVLVGAVMTALGGGDAAVGAAAGLAGVGVREVADQAVRFVKK